MYYKYFLVNIAHEILYVEIQLYFKIFSYILLAHLSRRDGHDQSSVCLCRSSLSVCLVLGFIPPTSGTAYVNGYDIREDIVSVRSSLGL